MRCRRGGTPPGPARPSYVLLETVIATGLLIVGLAVVGAQIQDAEGAIPRMELKVRAMMLAESQLAELDLGLVKLDSIDPVFDGDFGPRYPNFAWVLITEETALENMVALRLEIWHHEREDKYRPDTFDYSRADRLYTVTALRPVPLPIDLAADYGLPEEDFAGISDCFAQLGIPDLDPNNFNPRDLLGLETEQYLQALSCLSKVSGIGIDFDGLAGLLPPDIVDLLKESGALGGNDETGEPGAGGAGAGSGGR
ncbi:MAG: hypothetical protein HY763_15645 [Planctomycetes bacterium]|nr:hypothetical protein [Planctomycetota bacterium]